MRFFYPEYCRIQRPNGSWVPTKTGRELLQMLGETLQLWGDSEYLGYLCTIAYTRQAREADTRWRETHWPDIYPERAGLAELNQLLDSPNTTHDDADTWVEGTAAALVEFARRSSDRTETGYTGNQPPREKSAEENRFLEWARAHVSGFWL